MINNEDLTSIDPEIKRITGIGGLFFKNKDPIVAKEWYDKQLGFNTEDNGCTFLTKDKGCFT
ncbi:hypothetical protein [Lacinutrix jangbogonensis]|uniref:hypothetical protein n=1 Tax=Lacinutrix jangbogonensis TaxID=1469557 RepID=UPI000ABD3E88|nr:hypothetical protein [Lacinutrix jangbogonensis]